MDKNDSRAMIQYYLEVIENSKKPKHIEYAQSMMSFHIAKLELDTDFIKKKKYSTNTA
tara:strand:- start:5709 stop:5882 length:174 start_codon:yes stop_codon:yes gene_type:complete